MNTTESNFNDMLPPLDNQKINETFGEVDEKDISNSDDTIIDGSQAARLASIIKQLVKKIRLLELLNTKIQKKQKEHQTVLTIICIDKF